MNGFPANFKVVGVAGALASMLAAVTPAFGGGGLSELIPQFAPGGQTTHAADSRATESSGPDGAYSSTAFASASAQGGSEGRYVNVASGHDTTVQDVKGGLSITGETDTIVFQKGGNLLGKSRTETTTQITVNGQTYTVADEVAIAAARATQFGSSAAAAVDSSGGGFGNGSTGGAVSSGKAGGAR